jgi:hypothetical protein
MRNHRVYVGGRLHRHYRVVGSGMGSVLLANGGAGGGSSYPSVEAYEAITGNKPNSASGLGNKLSKLMVKPLTKKPHNIRFEM